MKLERLTLSDEVLGWIKIAPRVVISGTHGWLVAGLGFEGHRKEPNRRQLSITSDGRSFRPIACPLASPTQVLGTEHGVVVVEGSTLVISQAGGTWRELPQTPGVRLSLTAASTGPLLAVADGALVELETPTGTWRVVSSSVPGSGLLSAGAEMHFVRSSSELFRITKGGFAKATGLPKKCAVRSVAQLTSGTVFALSEASELFRSSDGVTFERLTLRHTELRQLAALNTTLVVIDREAVLKSTDEGRTFVDISRNPDAGFAAIASWGSGAFVIDSRRHAVFHLAPKNDSFWAPPLRIESERVEAGTPAEMVEASDGSDYRPYSVFTDWLQSVGDLMGETIAQLNRLQGNAAASELVARNAKSLLGSMSPEQVKWRFGFVESARVDSASVELLTLTAGRFTRELSFWSPLVEPAAFVALLGAGRWPALRKLHIDGTSFTDEDGLTWFNVGSLESLWRALPRLESLTASGENISVGTIEAPQLRRLKLVGAGAKPLRGSLPKLEELTLAALGAPFDAITVALPKLTSLKLLGTMNTDQVLEQVVPLTQQLTELSLFGGSLADPSVVLKHAAHLAHLRVLNLDGNRLSAEGIAAIAKVLPRASLLARV